jgi:N-acylglucosamine-6-phosphate 2-epimerase
MNIPKGLIVSCQVESKSAFTDRDVVKFSIESSKGGCVGLRIRGVKNVSMVKDKVNLPIIGLTKSLYKNDDVYITPTAEDGIKLFDNGADYIAMDATGRNGYKELNKLSLQNIPVIGDISNISQAYKAIDNGCVALTTALSGYTSECCTSDNPDYKLLEELINKFSNIPILAEGRYWERNQIKKAFDLGSHNVVIGTAITRPHLITKRLMEVYNEK